MKRLVKCPHPHRYYKLLNLENYYGLKMSGLKEFIQINHKNHHTDKNKQKKRGKMKRFICIYNYLLRYTMSNTR